MKLTAERLPASHVRLEIASEAEEFTAALDKATKRLAQRVTVPGFRRGKAPRPLVERHVGRAMLVSEANGDLMDDLYRRALEQEDLTPVARPDVEILQEEPLAFRVDVEVTPTVDITGYEAVRVEPEHISLTDQEVDEYLDRLREDNSPWVDPPTPRPVQEGDQIVVDIAAFAGDTPFDEPTTGATFVLGRDNLLPQIRDVILGASVGEPVERVVTFPAENAEGEEQPVPETLLGKTLTYRITVQSVKERQILPLDDELAAALGATPQSLASLRAYLRANLLRQKETQARVDLTNKIMEKLRNEVANVELGPALIAQQVEDDATQQLQQLGGMGLDLKEIFGKNSPALQTFMERIRPESETRLKNTLILRAIAEKEAEALAVSPDEVHEEVHRLGMSHSVLEDERTVELIQADLRERKLLDRVIALATDGKGIVDDSPPTAYTQPEEPEDEAVSGRQSAASEAPTGSAAEAAIVTAAAENEVQVAEAEAETATTQQSARSTQHATEDTPAANAGTMETDGASAASDATATAEGTPEQA